MWFLIFLIILAIVAMKSGGKKEPFNAREVLALVKGDPERVHEYLQIQSGIDGTNEQMVAKIAADKKISTPEEFMERVEMGPATFMTASEQIKHLENLRALSARTSLAEI